MICEIDPTYSHVSFAVQVMSVSTTRGLFKALRGRLHIDEQNPANSWVDYTLLEKEDKLWEYYVWPYSARPKCFMTAAA